MYYLFENNKICNIEKSKNDEENFSDEAFDKLVEQRHGKIKKKSENVFDLIEDGDLVRVEDGTFIVSMKNDRVFVIEIDEGRKVRLLNSIMTIYKPNKNGDYICVWRRENEEH